MRFLYRNPLQLCLAITGISTGVAAVIAVDAARQQVSSSFQQNYEQLQGGASHLLSRPGQYISMQQYLQLQQRYAAPMAPVISGRARILLPHSETSADASLAVVDYGVSTQSVQVDVLGIDLLAERQLFSSNAPDDIALAGSQTLALDDWLGGESVVMLSADLDARLPPGELLQLQTDEQHFELSSLGAISEWISPASNTVVMDIALAARILQRASPDKLRLNASSGQVTQLQQSLDSSWQLQAVGTAPGGMAAAFSMNMLAMGLLALLMGVLLVFSTYRLLLLQREPLHKLQYVLGTSQRELLSQQCKEAVLLGLAGTVLGLFSGLLLANLVVGWLQETLGDLFSGNGSSIWQISWRICGLACLAGVGSSLLALLPLAFSLHKNNTIEVRAHSRQHYWLLALSLVILLIGSVLIFQFKNLLTALGGLFAITLAYLLLTRPLLQWFGLFLQRTIGWQRWLALVAVRRLRVSIRSTAPALIALVLALATIIGISSMVDSFRGSVSDWLDITLSAPAYISNDGEPIPAGLVEQVQHDDSIQASGRIYSGAATVAGQRVELAILDLPVQGQQSYRMVSGGTVWQSTAELALPLMIGETLAQRRQLAVGDALSIEFQGITLSGAIVGIFQDYRAGPGRVVVQRDDVSAMHDLQLLPTSMGIYADDQQLVKFEQRLPDFSDWDNNLSLISAMEVKQTTLGIFDQTFLLTSSLRWIVALVALVGMCGAILALQLERGKELSLLHTLGLEQAEHRWLVINEAMLLGGMAIILALPLGGLLAWMLCEVINLRAFGWHIDTVVLPQHWLLAIVVGVLASLIASYLAARSATAGKLHGELFSAGEI